ncbi:MAG: hypothetical protein AABY32_02270 [Nanoarchaeota archaeon]
MPEEKKEPEPVTAKEPEKASWNHISMVNDGKLMKAFIDGKEVFCTNQEKIAEVSKEIKEEVKVEEKAKPNYAGTNYVPLSGSGRVSTKFLTGFLGKKNENKR